MIHPYPIIEAPFGWLLADDTDATPRCLAAGRLDWDETMRAIPDLARLKRGDLVIDVGAFIGTTVRIWEDMGCEVWAIEPQTDALYCLRHNARKSTTVIGCIAGDGRELATTEIECTRPNGSKAKRMCALPQNGERGEETLRLDDLKYPRRVAMLKIDVEGCEPWVLDGAREVIRRDKPLILVEMNREALRKQGFAPEDLHRRLRDLGYAWRQSHDDSEWHDLICEVRA